MTYYPKLERFSSGGQTSKNGSKIDMTVRLLDILPEMNACVIFQMDSWYTCKALWD